MELTVGPCVYYVRNNSRKNFTESFHFLPPDIWCHICRSYWKSTPKLIECALNDSICHWTTDGRVLPSQTDSVIQWISRSYFQESPSLGYDCTGPNCRGICMGTRWSYHRRTITEPFVRLDSRALNVEQFHDHRVLYDLMYHPCD